MIEELIKRYKDYSDLQLIEVYKNKENYTEEARKALEIVINEKGGLSLLQENYNKVHEIDEEKRKIEAQIIFLKNKGNSKDKIFNSLKSEIVSKSEINEILEGKFKEIETHEKDLQIKPRTVIGSILGAAIGGTIGGILWGLQMIYSAHIFYIFGLGLVMLSYSVIKFFTKQSKSNIVVLFLTILSVIYALVLGFFLYGIFGYRGVNPLIN